MERARDDELIGGEQELPHPGGRVSSLGPLSLRLRDARGVRGSPGIKQVLFVRVARGPSQVTVQIGVRLRAEHQCQGLTGFQPGAEGGYVQVVFAVVQAAVALTRQIVIAIPFVGRFEDDGCMSERHRSAQEIVGNRAIERRDAQATLDGRNTHAPVAGVGVEVKVAIIDQGLAHQLHRS